MHLLAPDDPITGQLRDLEPIFHRLPASSAFAEIAALTDPRFFEVGASGSVYDRAFVNDVVAGRYATGIDPGDGGWEVRDFAVHQLDGTLHLATYLLRHNGVSTRRATVWQCHDTVWTATYHQGTPVADGASVEPGRSPHGE